MGIKYINLKIDIPTERLDNLAMYIAQLFEFSKKYVILVAS